MAETMPRLNRLHLRQNDTAISDFTNERA